MAAAPGLLDSSVRDLLDAIRSDTPMPGSGAVAAVAVAMAAALCAMAARLSRGHWDGAAGAVAQAEALRERVLPLPDANAQVYAEALSALQAAERPEGPARDDLLGATLARAADVPLRIAEAALDVAELAALLARDGNPAVRGDALAAAFLAEAGAHSAASLVAVNLGATPDDERVARARALAAAAEAAARRAASE